MIPKTRLLALALLAASCASSGYDRAKRDDTAEAYARFLREQPADPRLPQAKRRLAELEFTAARRQNTVLAYKRFLETFPESERRKDAEVLLEGLRFETASKDDTSLAWNEFLRDHPAGAHSADAKKHLDEADYREAIVGGGSKPLEEYTARHPDSVHVVEAERLLDDRRYAEAQAQGPRGLAGYLEKNPVGVHRDQIRGMLAAHEAEARAWLGDFAGARRAADLVPEPALQAKTLALVDGAELDRLSARLDPKALEVFAATHSGAVSEEAKARSKALAKDRSGALKAIALRLDPSRFGRPREELVRVLSAVDPRDRWLAVEELGLIGARGAAEALLEAAASSRFSRVREKALTALAGLYGAMPVDVRELEIRSRLEGLRKVAQTPALQVKLALLEELLGEEPQAISDYQRCVGSEGADLFVQRRLAVLRIKKGEGFGAAVAARELASRVQQLVEQRSTQEGLSSLLLARTLCGARDEAQAALQTLQVLPAQVARDFPEDLQAFTRRALEAHRLASARLSDTEADARAADRSFKGCDDDGDFRERLAEGERDRLKAVAELSARPEARQALELVARDDPSAQVRDAAKAALAKGGKS